MEEVRTAKEIFIEIMKLYVKLGDKLDEFYRLVDK